MTDDYTREVLRDAIPLLEQLLERLKIITTANATSSSPTDCIAIAADVRRWATREIARRWPAGAHSFQCEYDIDMQSILMILSKGDRHARDAVPRLAAISDPICVKLHAKALLDEFH